MTMLRGLAGAVVLVGGLVLLLALIGLAGGELDAARSGVFGLALLAAGLVLFERAGRRRGGDSGGWSGGGESGGGGSW
ncbi:hypothetical protein OG559_19415 [Micromonospora sp. NBC_01405]|uniref:hypothetical protein n=1 Tax=Micromonospora sp. NBC_01405 TaxID=2903589 RepID=UPI003247A617